MPRYTDTRTLGDERERLDGLLDDIAEQAAKHEADSASFQRARGTAQQIEMQLVGVELLIEGSEDEPDIPDDGYGADAEVTVGALDAGEYGGVEDRTNDARNEKVGGSSVSGPHRLFYIAHGLHDAPFLDGNESIDQRVTTVRDLPPHVRDWLYDLVDEVTTPEVDIKNSFTDRVRQQAGQANDTES